MCARGGGGNLPLTSAPFEIKKEIFCSVEERDHEMRGRLGERKTRGGLLFLAFLLLLYVLASASVLAREGEIIRVSFRAGPPP